MLNDMDYKEKLEEAKRLYESANDEQKHIIENLFPELKESEGERIRKALINYLITDEDNGVSKVGQIPIDNVIAWLEKQVEQKSTNKVESKFHKGDWITNGDYTWKIVEVKPLYYILQSQDGNIIVDDTIFHTDEHFHSFTTEDAKDGDVLYSLDSKQPFIFKHRKTNEQANVYCGINIYGKFFVGNTKDCIITTDKYIPATKEQRDTLFTKMKESGYEFDFETKELKKIDTYCQENCKGFQETGRCFCDGECKAKKEYIKHKDKQKQDVSIQIKPSDYINDMGGNGCYLKNTAQASAWSKNDDYNVQCLIAKVTYDIQKGNIGRNQELIDWVKSLKKRINND